jgi:hypothetical protein
VDLDAIVLADNAVADVRIAGLSVRDRATRTAARAGARRVFVADAASPRSALVGWREGHDGPVLVIRADQLVHAPLVSPLIAPLLAAKPSSDLAISVGPDGAYAGAFLATGDAADRAIERLAAGDTDDAIAAAAQTRIPHGEIARHAIASEADRRGAHELLYRILVKPQDNIITRYLFRPISSRLSRLLVRTPVTATQVSSVVAVLVAIGCWLTTFASSNLMIAGALTILGASYLDCCDGEIARIKLQSSRVGAWIDTIVDELSSVGYMVALGWHCHLAYGRNYLGDLGFDPWIAAIVVGLATYSWALYCIYYNIIVGVGSANSQDYTSRFHVVPGKRPDSVRLAPVPPKQGRELPRWLAPIAKFMPNIVRRDFIVWMAALFAVLYIPHVSFGIHVLAGVVSSIVVTIDHVHLRAVRRSAARTGKILESPTP